MIATVTKGSTPNVSTLKTAFTDAARRHAECRATREAFATRRAELVATIQRPGAPRREFVLAQLQIADVERQEFEAEEAQTVAAAAEATARSAYHAALAGPLQARARALMRKRQDVLDEAQRIERELVALHEEANAIFSYGWAGQIIIPADLLWPELGVSTPLYDSLVDHRRECYRHGGWLP